MDEEFKSSDKYFGVPIEKQRRAVRLYRIWSIANKNT